MIVREIVHTCSNVHVARAALASIGGDFARYFAAKASSRNLPAGVLAAEIVKDFAHSAAEEEWDGVDEAARCSDQPILSGLRYILVQGLRDLTMSGEKAEGAPPAWICAAELAGARG